MQDDLCMPSELLLTPYLWSSKYRLIYVAESTNASICACPTTLLQIRDTTVYASSLHSVKSQTNKNEIYEYKHFSYVEVMVRLTTKKKIPSFG